MANDPAPTPDPTPDPDPAPTPDPSPDPDPGNSQPEPNVPLVDAPAPDNEPPPVANWREDWRTALAGDNEDALKTLNRFKTPEGLWKSYNSIRTKVSSGELAKSRPDTGDAEAMKAWREEMGLPDAPTGYLDAMEGLEVPAEDQPIVDRYLERMWQEGADPASVKQGLDWWYETQQQTEADRTEEDKSYRRDSEDDLRGTWGSEYRSNINGVKFVMAQFAGDETFAAEVMTARTDDGRMLGDNPAFLKMLANINGEINPMGAVPGGEGETSQAGVDVNARVAELEAEMGDTKGKESGGYWNSPAKQDELRRLYEIQDKRAARAGKAA